MPLVIDASCGLGFLLCDERDALSTSAFTEILNGTETFVPAHWAVEVANVLRLASPKRMSEDAVAQACEFASGLPLQIDDETFRRAFTDTLALAKEHKLTVHDAAYLELAMRKGATLATKDVALAKAAKSAGVPLL